MSKNAIIQKSPTFNEYHNFLTNSEKIPEFKNKKHYLQQYSFFKSITDVMPCAVYILNFATQEYLYVSESCEQILGYTAKEFMNFGRKFFITLVDNNDMKIVAKEVFERLINYAKPLNAEELKKCRFSLNYRLKRKDGIYIKLLQQYVVLEVNKQGYPVLTLGVITDITAHKADDKITFSISHYDKKTGFKTISSDSYVKVETTLTPREIEIVKYIVSGHTTPEMADILFISQHTLKTHRKNIFKKTNCKNVVELVNYAIVNGVT